MSTAVAPQTESLQPRPTKNQNLHNAFFRFLTVLFLVIVFNPAARADSYFIDLESGFTPHMASGRIGETSVAISVTGAPQAFFISPATQTDCSNVTNFNSELAFRPAMRIGGALGIRKQLQVGSATATVTFTFSQPITNPLFHFFNVDRTEIAFQAVDGIRLISGNGDAMDGLGIRDNRVFDVDPSTANDSANVVFTGPRSGAGTVRINGTYTTISATLSQVATLGDLVMIQISSEFEPPPFKVTSFKFSPDSGFGELHFVGPPQSLFQIRYSSTLNFANAVILKPSAALVGVIENGSIRSCSNGKGAVQVFLGNLDRGFVRVEAID